MRRGIAASSQRNLAARNARQVERGRLLRAALRDLLATVDPTRRRQRKLAQRLQWHLGESEHGRAYLGAFGYPSLRSVQEHLKHLRAFPYCAESVSVLREKSATTDADGTYDTTAAT